MAKKKKSSKGSTASLRFARFQHGGRAVAINRQAVLYVYEIDADVSAIVVGAPGGDERTVAVDGSIAQTIAVLDDSDEEDPALARLLADFSRPWGADGPVGVWRGTPIMKSPHPDLLRPLWEQYRAAPDQAERLSDHWFERYDSTDLHRLNDISSALFACELQLIVGRYDRAFDLSERLASKHGTDLRLQDIRARARILGDGPSRPNIDDAIAPFRDRFCPSTFDTVAFFENDVFACCCNYLPTSIGSVRTDTYDQLWNGDTARTLRAAIHDGSFQYCNKMVCPRLRNDDLPRRDAPGFDAYYQAIIAEKAVAEPLCHPRTIELNEDPACNLTCPSCRKDVVLGDRPFLARFEKNVLSGVLANPLNSFLIACYGEPFASKHYMRVLASLDPAVHQIGTLVIYTNGVLLDEAMWDRFPNLRGFNIEMRVSIDAAQAETYAKVRRRGSWDRLTDNLDFIADLRRSEVVSKLVLAFVVQAANYREMEAFVRLGKTCGADEVFFAEMQKFGEYDANDALFEANAVHLASHPEHADYLALLGDEIMRDPIVSLHGCKVV